MPAHTSKVPGSTGSTVPAKPNTIKTTHNTHSNVISTDNFQDLG